MTTEEIEQEIFEGSLFNDFKDKIERYANKFEREQNISLNSEIYLEDDWEVLNHKKVILLINPESDIFNKKMKVWKNLSDFLTTQIKSEIDFQEYVKRFFIKLKLN